ncbi:MAG: methylase [bacterium]|nr:methylase [bacterium]
MPSEAEQRLAAQQFAAQWKDKGDEKQDTQKFWLDLLQFVMGLERPSAFIEFEVPVKLDNVSFIDAYILETRVLIEQKSRDVNLRHGQKQSDGSLLTPYQQARRYAGHLPYDKVPRWICLCNFRKFWVYDMLRPNDAPEIILLSDLPKDYHRLRFLTDTGDVNLKREMELSLQAGDIVGRIYEALLRQYRDPESPESLKSLNALCVRLVFCLYAEDSTLFGRHLQFHDYLQKYRVDAREALIKLFKVLDTPEGERDPYLNDDLAAFPYVNGGLFADENIEIPRLTDEIVDLILRQGSEDFDWSGISPTIFGAVFESTLNPETRRSGGMHYTSIENIHKLIDPLFLDALRQQLKDIQALTVKRTRTLKLKDFQAKLASLTFLDPACGSGNFLTETYISLRRLENEVLKELLGDQVALGFEGDEKLIKVDIGQFYGIEINDFAVTVAKTALWIAESQMLRETENIVNQPLRMLPLRSYANIVEGNALRLDWESVVPKEKLNYIMGNPPFVGYSLQSRAQKEDILAIYRDEKGKSYKNAGKMDYVAGWYYKCCQLMQGTNIRAALVSTNSITQGEQVAGVWQPLYERFNPHIDFAHRTFRWDSEAHLKAHVHCVIVGFSCAAMEGSRRLFSGERCQECENINPYLAAAPPVFISNRQQPLCAVPRMTTGNRPADGGALIIEAKDYAEFLRREPKAKKYIKKMLGSEEFINNKERWCLWLVGITPAELRSLPEVLKRVELCRQARLNSPDPGRRKLADRPTQFREILNPRYCAVIPKVSSERRRYVPMGFVDDNTILTDLVFIVPDATLFHFGVLTSNVHMAWMRLVCGRLKSDYRYSKDLVYNNFPWPEPSAQQRAKVEETAQGILAARALYPDSSLADLYDEIAMPPELRTAHQKNDIAVMEAYGFDVRTMNEADCVAALMQRYQELVKAQKSG